MDFCEEKKMPFGYFKEFKVLRKINCIDKLLNILLMFLTFASITLVDQHILKNPY